MKKATIKRRKRVVPAYTDSPSQPGTSTSPEPSSEREESGEADPQPPSAKRQRPPPSIDFTGFDPTTPDAGKTQSAEAADYARQAQIVAAATAAIGRHSYPEHTEAERKRIDRREALLREAELMRAALKAKEKEIDEMQ
jgi:hypothetical protein